MRMLSTSGGWRVSILSATTRGFQWTHGKRLVSRSVKPSELPTASPSTEHAVSSKASTPAEDAKTPRTLMPTPLSGIGIGRRKRWSADEIRHFLELYDKSMSNGFIAAQMPGRTYNAIVALRHQHMHNILPRPAASRPAPWTVVERKRLLELSEAGLTVDEMRSHFPDRSAMSVKVALENNRIEFSEGGVPAKAIWTAIEVSDLRRHVAQGTSALEISRCLNRSLPSVRGKIVRLGIGKGRCWITPEEKQTIVEMHDAGFSQTRIAKLLGCSILAVESHWNKSPRPRSHDLETRRSHRFELSSKGLESVEHLRKEGVSWEVITHQTFAEVNAKTVAKAFARQMAEAGRPSTPGVTIHRTSWKASERLVLSSGDIEDIAAQRKDGKTWAGIAKFFPAHSCIQVSRAFTKQAPEVVKRTPLEKAMATTDTREITRLRDDGKTWHEIAELKYPEWSYRYVRTVYVAQLQKQRDQDISSAG